MKRRVEFVVRGRVQGVAFRYSARNQAERLGVEGWIRNLDSGEVVGAVQGDPDRVEAFLAWCEQGPAGARVEALERVEQPPAAATGAFEIRR